MNEAGQLETWEFKGGSWVIGSFSQVGAAKLSELELYTFLFQELYIDFSQQSQYKASDISKCSVARNIDGDWHVLFYNSANTVICGDHKTSENFYLEANRNNIIVKAVVNWDRVAEGESVTFNNIKITSTDSLIERNSLINYRINIQPLQTKIETLEGNTVGKTNRITYTENDTLNSFFKELLLDFSAQDTYSISDIDAIAVRKLVTDGVISQAYIYFYKDGSTIVCGNYVTENAQNNDEIITFTRNNITCRCIVDWSRIDNTTVTASSVVRDIATRMEYCPTIYQKQQAEDLRLDNMPRVCSDLGVYDVTSGYNLSSSSGEAVRDANYSMVDDYIDLSDNMLRVEGAVLNRVSYYDADKAFVRTHVSPTINKDYVTQNAFARVAFLNSDNADGYENLRVYNSEGTDSLKEQITQVQGNVTAMEKRISNVSDNADANTILREIYVDFSRQETYSAADINRFYLNRNNDGDWYLFICKDRTIVCGGHTRTEEPTGIVKYTRNNIDIYAIINWDAVPTEAKEYSYDLSFHALDNLDYSPSIKAGLISDNMESMVNEIIEEGLQDFQTNEKFINAIQVSDGLSLTSASAPQIGFDDTAALVGVASQAAWLEYGESYQQIRLDIFQVSQPTNVRHVIVAKQGESIGGSETFSISTEVNVLALGNRVWRTMFQHKNGWWYRDYHFDTETLDDAVEMKFKDGESEAVSITVDTRKTYVASKGYDDSAVNTNIMTSSYYRDSETKRVYGCWTGYDAHAILFYSDDNLATIIPFAIFPNTVQYEASIVYVGSRLHIITRGANSVAYSDDNGSYWEITPITADNNRPRLYNYNGKPIWMYGVSGRSRITAKYGDDFNTAETLFDLTSYWGCVYPSLLVRGGDMYIAYSDRQLHLADNWAKDAIKFMYAGKIE